MPNIIGNQNLKELQELIINEKAVLQGQERLGSALSASATSLAAWGSTQGADLSDILSHANSILQHLAQAFQTYANREADIRVLLKNIRSREEEFEELLKRRRNTGAKAEREEKKLAKMGQENKNLQAQTELLSELRESMKQMDTEILVQEAKLGDFKRQVTKEALGIKFGGCFELAEKAQIVGELGKLLIEEIPLEQTPAGYGRAPYEGAEQTQRLSAEADRVVCDNAMSWNGLALIGDFFRLADQRSSISPTSSQASSAWSTSQSIGQRLQPLTLIPRFRRLSTASGCLR